MTLCTPLSVFSELHFAARFRLPVGGALLRGRASQAFPRVSYLGTCDFAN